MAYEHIMFDKTEIVLIVMGKKKPQVLNVTYDKIMRIQFDRFMERKFFKKVPSEKIIIMIRGRDSAVEFTKLKEKKYFEKYKEGLRKFAKDNRLTFMDNIGE
jgi:hypothetical protein